jgi:hypothetical protein
MKKRLALLPPAELMPIVKALPASKAASIGRTLTRFSYLEWRMAKTIYSLLGIGIKQGRVAVRLGQLKPAAQTAEGLLEAVRIRTNYNFKALGKKLDAAERARNVLAHSLFLEGKAREIHVQVVRGSWELPQDVEGIRRAVDPQSVLVDRKFLAEQRRLVETAIRAAEEFGGVIHSILGSMNEQRRTRPALDRRKASEP